MRLRGSAQKAGRWTGLGAGWRGPVKAIQHPPLGPPRPTICPHPQGSLRTDWGCTPPRPFGTLGPPRKVELGKSHPPPAPPDLGTNSLSTPHNMQGGPPIATIAYP